MLTIEKTTIESRTSNSSQISQNTSDSTKRSEETPRIHKFGYFSSYDRGLQHLLKMWPTIKEKYPDATLDVCYGWELFDRGYADNPERMAWKERINTLMEQPGVTHHGRVSKEELKRIESTCGIWAYPTDFGETNCITALDCQANGCVPVVINHAGLKESVGSGVKIDGDIYDDETYEAYLEALLSLMGDENRWKEEQVKGKEWAMSFTWDKIADKWEESFK